MYPLIIFLEMFFIFLEMFPFNLFLSYYVILPSLTLATKQGLYLFFYCKYNTIMKMNEEFFFLFLSESSLRMKRVFL